MNEIITLAEAKEYLRIEYSDDDYLITTIITAAHEWALSHCGHTLDKDPDDPCSTEPPKKFKLGLLYLVHHWYENRELVAMGNTIPREVPFTITAIFAQARRIPL